MNNSLEDNIWWKSSKKHKDSKIFRNFSSIFRFPYWFNKLTTSILTLVCFCLSVYRRDVFCLIGWPIQMIIYVESLWHTLLFCIEVTSGLKVLSEEMKMLEYPWCTLSEWCEPLWWSVLRDGGYFIVVICTIISLHLSHLPCSYISDQLFNEYQLFDEDLSNLSRLPIRPRQRRRSPCVIHYVLLRRGYIRYRSCKRFFHKKQWLNWRSKKFRTIE